MTAPEPERAGVSVVIATYGREEVLLETIRRVLEQDPAPLELLVVDQTPSHIPSVEREMERLAKAGTVKWFRLEEPSIPHAMNVGLLRARSEIVLFLDDDVVPSPGLIAAHLEAHVDSGAVAVVGQVLLPGEDPVIEPGGPTRFSSGTRGWVTEVIGANFSIRRESALRVGGMDENFVRAAYGFEAEFCERLRASGANILFEPRATLEHLRAPAGGTRAYGRHLRTFKPGHSVGAFYRILRTGSRGTAPIRIAGRLARSVRTRHHLSRPWWIPVTLVAETLGLGWAIGLTIRGPRLLAGAARIPAGDGNGEGEP
ncbi:MAG: glycosyltransferase family 2 protein [Gemmatimonadota bacterium]